MGDGNETGRATEAESAMLAELARCREPRRALGLGGGWAARVSGADGARPLRPGSGPGDARLRRARPARRHRGAAPDASRDGGLAPEVLRDRANPGRARTTPGPPRRRAPLRGRPTALVSRSCSSGERPASSSSASREAPARARLTAPRAVPAPRGGVRRLARAAEGGRRPPGAIERLTSLYDLSKAFGSTIDLGELSTLVVRKAADFAAAEAASLWFLEREGRGRPRRDGRQRELRRSNPPAVVGAVPSWATSSRIARPCGRTPSPDDTRAARRSPSTHSLLAVPLVEDDAIGALVLVEQARPPSGVHGRRRGAACDLARQAVRALRQRPPVRGREEGRGARRAPDREPRDHGDAGPRQGHEHDRERDGGPHPLRPLRDRDPDGAGCGSAPSRGCRAGPHRPDLKRTEELLEWVYYGGTDVAVEQRGRRLETDRPETEEKFRDVLRGERAERVLRRDPPGRGGKLGVSASRAPSRSSSTRRRATSCRSSSTRRRSRCATRSSTSRCRSSAS